VVLKPVIFTDMVLKEMYDLLVALNEAVTATSGGQVTVQVTDSGTNELLAQVRDELRIMNVHLAILTDNEVEEEDVLQ